MGNTFTISGTDRETNNGDYVRIRSVSNRGKIGCGKSSTRNTLLGKPFHSVVNLRDIIKHFWKSSFSALQVSSLLCLHLGKNGCCKSETGISKLGTDDIMEVDRRNAKTTDRQIPSNKDTDTPGVFDTHLTKKDVYSKIYQNDWRDGIFNPRRKHLPVHQVIVIFLFTISFAQEYRSSPATIAIIVLSSSLVLAGTSLILFLLYIFWKHQIHYATRFNLKNCKSEIRTSNKHEEACELL